MLLFLIFAVAVAVMASAKSNRGKGQRVRVAVREAAPAPEIISPAEIKRRERDREKAAREAEKARKKAEATAQAKQDYSFYSARFETLLEIETDTARSYYSAVEAVEHDAQQNKYSYVIGEKTVQKHIAERDRLQSRLLKIQTQIHGVEKQIAKAKYTLQAGA